jgi:vacuolar protein sorting-associated protein 26
VDFAVHTLSSYPEMNSPIKMEVGIEDCLHIEFEYNKSKYHLKDVIVGKIYFLLVRIKIKHMEIAIIKRETTGAGESYISLFLMSLQINNFCFILLGSNVFTENETIAKYEIMDGAPVKGESIPIRVFLAGYDLTPTMRDINKKFSVRYFLNLVLMDTEDRRYFKQQEITLWRKSEKTRKSLSNSAIGGLENSQSNLTQAQQNAQMPTHLVTSTAGHPGGVMVVDTNAIPQPGSHTSPAGSTIVEHSNNNMGLFTEEESPQHEALGSKVRSNPLAFDTDEDKTPSKEEEVPVVGGKEPPKQQPSLEESSSLFDEPVTSEQQSNNIVSNNDEVVEQSENSNVTENTMTTIDDEESNN